MGEAKKKAAEKPKKRLSKKQKKKLAAQKLQQEKEEKERQEKEAAEAAAAELLAQTSKKKKKKKTKKQVEGESQPAPAPESKKKGKKKAEEAPIEPEPALTTQDADEDTDGWEKVPSQSRKSRRKRGGGNNSAEGKSQAPKGPIVQEILELGARPNDNKADDPVRKKILDVLGFPSRKSLDDAAEEDNSKFGRNVKLFKLKLNVDMEFKETRTKYYLLMNGSPESCQQAINAAKELFDKGYSDILTPGMTQESFPVAEKDRGAIVGKGGANLQAIQDEFSVQIRLPARNGNSDLVTLSGPIEGVKHAKAAIMQLVSTGISDVTHPDSAVAEVLIPNRRKAALIGTRGANIQRIQQAYNCRINVPQNLPGQKPNDKVSVIIAGEKALIAAAVADVRESVAEPEPEQIPGFSKELTCEYDPWAED